MEINPKIFKAYDIRGIVPDEINPEGMEAIARAFVAFLRNRFGSSRPQMILSRDARISSQELSSAALRGLVSGGARVIDAGLTSTPMHYWLVGSKGADGGFMVSASHNPKNYNGAKLTGKGVMPLGKAECFGELQDLITHPDAPGKSGTVEVHDFLESYIEHEAGAFAFKPITVVCDASNGASGPGLRRLFERFPEIHLVSLYFDPDGTFPNHGPNPFEPEAQLAIKAEIVRTRAAFGAIFDGDGDRIFFFDEQGAFVPPSNIGALLAELVLQRHPGGAAVYNIAASRILPETIEAAGGRAIASRTGHTFIKQVMQASDAVFGAEHTGHFYFHENFGAEDPLQALLLFLDLITRTGKSFSSILKPYDRYVSSGEINFTAAWDRVAPLIRKEFSGGTRDETDGITVDFPDWRFNVRASNTEPLVRLNIEALDQATLEAKVEELSKLIRNA